MAATTSLNFKFFAALIVVLASFTATSTAMAQAPKTLIQAKGGEYKAGLAKSWEKQEAGKYKFMLDTSVKLQDDEALTPAIVKTSLEAKLGSKYGMKVEPQGKDAVIVSFKADADEAEVLKQISKTRIRAKSVELALETTVSEGGIRAKTAERAAEEGEVKGSVISSAKGVITVRVLDAKVEGVKAGKKVKFRAPEGFTAEAKEVVFFMPAKKGKGKIWSVKDGSAKKE